MNKLCNTLETRDQELQTFQEKESLLQDDITSAKLHSEKLQTTCDEQGKYLVQFVRCRDNIQFNFKYGRLKMVIRWYCPNKR